MSSALRAGAAEWKPPAANPGSPPGGTMYDSGGIFSLPPSAAPEPPGLGNADGRGAAAAGGGEGWWPEVAEPAPAAASGAPLWCGAGQHHSNPMPDWDSYETDPAAYGFAPDAHLEAAVSEPAAQLLDDDASDDDVDNEDDDDNDDDDDEEDEEGEEEDEEEEEECEENGGRENVAAGHGEQLDGMGGVGAAQGGGEGSGFEAFQEPHGQPIYDPSDPQQHHHGHFHFHHHHHHHHHGHFYASPDAPASYDPFALPPPPPPPMHHHFYYPQHYGYHQPPGPYMSSHQPGYFPPPPSFPVPHHHQHHQYQPHRHANARGASTTAFPTSIEELANSTVMADLLDEIHNLPSEMFDQIPLERLREVQIEQIEAQIAEESEKGITFDPESHQVVFIKDVNGKPIDPSQQERGIHRKLPLRLVAERMPPLPGSAGAAPSGVSSSGAPAAGTYASRLLGSSSSGPGGGRALDDDTTSVTTSRSKAASASGVSKQAKKRVDAAQRSASEAFSYAVLQSVSPFMAALRQRTGTSLPHIKVDQRFGKRGAPQTAVAQFIVAPTITGYRPTHFHEVTPGDLMEFHFDLSLVLDHIRSASAICVAYGGEWKPHAMPYLFLSCTDYRGEVKKLCPDEIPNSKGEAMYSNDIVKDIGELLFSIDELEDLRSISFAQAMRKRRNLQPLYDVFDSVFSPVGNYQIQIRQLHDAPSTYVIRTSADELEKQIQKGGPITLSGDPALWDDLPISSNNFVASTLSSRPAPATVGKSSKKGAGPMGDGAGSGESGAAKAIKSGGAANDTSSKRQQGQASATDAAATRAAATNASSSFNVATTEKQRRSTEKDTDTSSSATTAHRASSEEPRKGGGATANAAPASLPPPGEAVEQSPLNVFGTGKRVASNSGPGENDSDTAAGDAMLRRNLAISAACIGVTAVVVAMLLRRRE